MTNPPNRPIPESYWVIPGKLLAGEYPALYKPETTRKRIDSFLDAGFTTFIDLTRPNENVPYHDMLSEEANIYGTKVKYYNYPIGDFGLPTPQNMKAILDTIDEELAKGEKVYVHCWGGIGRTGTTIGCHLVRHGKTGREAIAQLSEWWQTVPKSRIHQRSPETTDQVHFILNWETYEK